MSEIVLFAAPGSCSLVPSIALEETGASYEYRIIRFARGEHKSPDFKRVNPAGKVPALLVDGEALAENVAILGYLNAKFPDAKLLPTTSDALERARQIADLSFFSSTIHPLLTRLRMPMFFAGTENSAAVAQAAASALPEYVKVIEDKLSDDWWYGNQWSVVDGYLYWAFRRIEGGNFDLSPYEKYRAHAARMAERPAVQRALAREAEAFARLEKEGLGTPPAR